MNREAERKRLVELVRQGIDIPCVTDNPWDEEACKGCRWKGDADCHAAKIADHLLDNGIVVPPCKVGQTVWLIKSLNWQHTEWGIKEGKVSMIQQKADKSWKFRITENHSVSDYTVDAIGKTVFLTREDALKSLEGKEDGKR